MEVIVSAEYRPEMLEGIDVEGLARFVMEREELPATTEVSITFVDDEEIARLNGEYRGKEGPTDVLSFECDGLDDEFGDPEGDEPFQLGDVVIAIDVCERQTELYGTTFKEEIELLLTHGLLHLCGYDHIEDDEAEEMEGRERELLGAWRSR